MVELAPFMAGWTGYSPTITQGGSVTRTVTSARYVQVGKLVIAAFNLSVTGTGTAANNMTISLPVTARDGGGGFKYGCGAVFDSSTSTSYAGLWTIISTTSTAFVGDWSGANAWGLTPNLAIANGDGIQGILLYEAA